MSLANAQIVASGVTATSLRWTGRVLSAEDLRGSLNGQVEVVLSPSTVVTPMASDQLKAQGVRVIRRAEDSPTTDQALSAWGIALERPDALVTSAVRSLEREGIRFKTLSASGGSSCGWARALAECVARGECAGGVGFAADPGLICCLANKVKGLRAAAVCSVNQATRAVAGLAANLIVVEMPGRTLFEIKQILKCACAGGACPPETITMLRELEHAHR
ncbi:MAG: RpiB/LacA/LacB family sugar-phosphate isomerase [Planctomycetes bacterium]|nr:RpiB/LacA/LacB family sugar-phosphate isomerase [Planctomycetota bacterium]